MCWKSHPRSNSSRDYPLPPTRPTTRAAFVTWRAASALKAACRIRHNECSLCSASPVVKLAFHDNLRQILGSRLHRRFRLSGACRSKNQAYRQARQAGEVAGRNPGNRATNYNRFKCCWDGWWRITPSSSAYASIFTRGGNPGTGGKPGDGREDAERWRRLVSVNALVGSVRPALVGWLPARKEWIVPGK
jgi:hypothetical protein